MYTKFPEMLEKTEQKDEYEQWREKAALTMVKEDKISFSLGVQISCLDRKEFSERLREAGGVEERLVEINS